MTTISINPSTFAYICSEYTIYPAIVAEHEDLKVTFQADENKKAEAKLKQFIEANF